ncbi:MAG: SsrA-binding protein SmpB [Planctomycetota bacterium]
MANPGTGKKSNKKKSLNDGVVCRNKQATFKYEIVEQHEAGIILLGSEVKSLRTGEASLKESFAVIKDDHVWLIGAFIPPYHHAYTQNHESTRKRELLLHRREIKKLSEELKKGGMTLIPLELRFNSRGYAKIVLALARGKRMYDKRQDLKKKDAERMINRRLRNS